MQLHLFEQSNLENIVSPETLINVVSLDVVVEYHSNYYILLLVVSVMGEGNGFYFITTRSSLRTQSRTLI